LLFWVLYRKNQIYVNLVLKPFDITASELPVLAYLYNNEGSTQEEIACFQSLDKAMVARIVKSLIEKDFIKKEKDIKDKRANNLYLTEHAKRSETEIFESLNKWSTFLMEGTSKEDEEFMYSMLIKMVKRLDNINVEEIVNKTERQDKNE